MAKRKKTIIAGPLVKTILYTAPEPNDTPRVRAVKSRMTTAAQKAMNDKAACAKLEMLLAANFTGRDLFLTLTYDNTHLPRNRREARTMIRKLWKQVRAYRKARGQALKYIYNTEDKHGEGRLHHHVILNATERDIDVIRSLWPYGAIDIAYLGDREWEDWAGYLTKERDDRPVGAQLWTGSRNLEKPKVYMSYVSNDETLTVPHGCHIIEREEKITEHGSYCYIKYRIQPRYNQREAAPKIEAGPPWDTSPLLSGL